MLKKKRPLVNFKIKEALLHCISALIVMLERRNKCAFLKLSLFFHHCSSLHFEKMRYRTYVCRFRNWSSNLISISMCWWMFGSFPENYGNWWLLQLQGWLSAAICTVVLLIYCYYTIAPQGVAFLKGTQGACVYCIAACLFWDVADLYLMQP